MFQQAMSQHKQNGEMLTTTAILVVLKHVGHHLILLF